ncbi:Porin b (Outer membrane) (Glucose porin) transmembrane protein [Novosphingobium resinovorum]|uniref:Porin b (Outer membrane) (Glucose porin) transmembrane protein n=1 Tax=Novosphingobium resinovorum TaxID=158500 RepID=A0A031JQK9_9SPHN|nr:carbohydrate porin [Novosphingobium resinovorum]EZP79035.1 Porin b (Outer membrane) (Glucose porin) transmembrane protein [Novosphingobium resinovorum]
MPAATLPPPLPSIEVVQVAARDTKDQTWSTETTPKQSEPFERSGPKTTAASAPAEQPHLLGDWAGIRTSLEDIGIKPTISYIGFVAGNLNSGTSKQAQYAGQLGASLDFDMGKIAGIEGGTFRAAVTNRHGNNINDTNHLDLLQYPQGVFGAGQIWRLAGLWYQQKLGPAEIKLGKMSMGEDFGSTTCHFQSLYFCGVVPGHTSFNYWYNFPVTTWGGRVKVKDKLGYTMVGVYQRNDNNFPQNKGFYMGFKGQGAFVAVERGFDVKLGGNPKLAGTYKVGAFFDTSKSSNLVYDDNGGFAQLTGDPLARERGRASIYAVARQQFTAADADGAGALEAFFNFVSADHRTNKLVNVITAGVTYSGLIPGRPKDQIGLAVGRSRVNRNLRDLQDARNAALGEDIEPQSNEYAIEANYSIALMAGLSLRPNLQWYINPGGRQGAKNVLVAGTGVFANF